LDARPDELNASGTAVDRGIELVEQVMTVGAGSVRSRAWMVGVHAWCMVVADGSMTGRIDWGCRAMNIAAGHGRSSMVMVLMQKAHDVIVCSSWFL
jgi:hypothetical protein